MKCEYPPAPDRGGRRRGCSTGAGQRRGELSILLMFSCEIKYKAYGQYIRHNSMLARPNRKVKAIKVDSFDVAFFGWQNIMQKNLHA